MYGHVVEGSHFNVVLVNVKLGILEKPSAALADVGAQHGPAECDKCAKHDTTLGAVRVGGDLVVCRDVCSSPGHTDGCEAVAV